jgi:uncharacterized protein with von Willebrand factor type A (vWA) domain
MQLAEDHLLGLAAAMREAGMAVAPQRHIDFLRGIEGSRLPDLEEVYWVARVTLVSDVGDLALFEAIFEAWCFAGVVISETRTAPDEESDVPSAAADDEIDLAFMELGEGSGRNASGTEHVGQPTFAPTSAASRAECASIRSTASAGISRERSRRLRATQRGSMLDLRRILRTATRSGGEIMDLAYRDRPWRQRRLLVLIDVSGSLKANSHDFLRFAHAVVAGAERAEAFTIGTKLTRITSALREDDVDDSLNALSSIIHDMDGGTRIGAALDEFLSTSRWVGLASGAVVIVLSDGLERGSPDAMIAAVDRLARISHRLVWLTPLASDPAYEPATRAMAAIRPSLDRLGSSASLTDLRAELEHVQRVSAEARHQCPRQSSYRL